MRRVEHTAKKVAYTEDAVKEAIDQMAEDGWELVCMVPVELVASKLAMGRPQMGWWMHFKRPWKDDGGITMNMMVASLAR
jgi:hypothetical protein